MEDGIKPALAVGQIWKDRSGWEIVLGVSGSYEGFRICLPFDCYTADGMHVRDADETQTDHDLMSFVGWIDGYGPSTIEHKAVSVEETPKQFVKGEWIPKVGDYIEASECITEVYCLTQAVTGRHFNFYASRFLRGKWSESTHQPVEISQHCWGGWRPIHAPAIPYLCPTNAPTDAELHARDSLTATDRRLLNERMERQRHECDAAHKKFDDLGMLILIEQSANKDQFIDHEDHGNYIRLTGCTK